MLFEPGMSCQLCSSSCFYVFVFLANKMMMMMTILCNFLRCRRRSVQKPWKATFSITPLTFDAPSPENPCKVQISAQTLCRQKLESMAYIFAVDSMGLSSFKFCGGLRKTHLFWNRMRIDRSRSSKVVDFDPSYINLSYDRTSDANGLCSFKILSLVKADDSLRQLPRKWYPKGRPSGGSAIEGIATSSFI